MTDEQLTAREIAERRVRERHERERTRLEQDLKAERYELSRRYREKRERLDRLQVHLTERKQEAETAHARAWQQERARLGSRTTTAPLFGLFGPPVRNVQAEYAERRERWKAQGEAIKERFDQQLRLIAQERGELRKSNAQHAIQHRQKAFRRLAELDQRQQRTFESDVKRALSRGEKRLDRTFERRARDAGHER